MMTEPVAYLVRNARTTTTTLRFAKVNSDFYENIPLYTEEQLHFHLRWFVRAKKQMSDGKYLYLENSILNNIAPEYHQIKLTHAQQFDTKEEAEKWTNPLTEAVQLPVEEE